MTPFLGSKSEKKSSGVGFGPKPTSGPNFVKIGVGDRTVVYHFLENPLLSVYHCISYYDRCEDEREQALYYLQTLNTIDFSCFTNAYTKSSVLYQVKFGLAKCKPIKFIKLL